MERKNEVCCVSLVGFIEVKKLASRWCHVRWGAIEGRANWIINIYIFVGGMFAKVGDKVGHSTRDTRKWKGHIGFGEMLCAQQKLIIFLINVDVISLY